MRMLVSQGEIGVMHAGNAGTITEMVTFGASPCVILAVQKGDTIILAHIHRANSSAHLERQLAEILGDARSATGRVQAFISTERCSDAVEVPRQQEVANSVKRILDGLGIVYQECAFSAAIVSRGRCDLVADHVVATRLTASEMNDFVEWAQAYDKRFGRSDDMVPMAIRVGKNSETPDQAMIRMYGPVTGVSASTSALA